MPQSESKKEALELEQHIRVVELKEKQFDFVVTTDMLFQLLEEDDLKNGRKIAIQVHKETIMSVILSLILKIQI